MELPEGTTRTTARASNTTATTAKATTTTPTTVAGPVYSECVAMDISTPNEWRATEGVPALSASSSLAASACAWSRHMAEINQLVHSGSGAEVIAMKLNNPWGWGSWKNSPSHYGILTSAGATQIGCGAVKVVRDAFHYEWWTTCKLQ